MRISEWSSDVCSSDLSSAAIGEAAAVPPQHLDIGQQMMSERYRLGVLQMRKARHNGLRVPFRLTEQCLLTGLQRRVYSIDLVAHPQAEIRRHLIVARTRGMQPSRGRPDPLGEARFHVHVDVFELASEGEPTGAQLLADR